MYMNSLSRFVDLNLSVSKLHNAVFVPEGVGIVRHKDRYTNCLVFELSGASRYDFQDDDSTSLALSQGGVLFLPKNSTYDVTKNPEKLPACYAINFDLIEWPTKPFVCYPNNGEHILQRFQSVEHIWSKHSFGYYEQSMAVLYEIICLIKHSIYPDEMSSPKQRLLIPAMGYIHEHYLYETISMGELARMCGLSQSYFRKIFREVTNDTPKSYIESLKFEKAKELIMTGEYNISEIAGMCGFSNDSYFCKKFRERFGMSPTKYLTSGAK